jgi:DNA-binding IclR family transcriptional regulator
MLLAEEIGAPETAAGKALMELLKLHILALNDQENEYRLTVREIGEAGKHLLIEMDLAIVTIATTNH